MKNIVLITFASLMLNGVAMAQVPAALAAAQSQPQELSQEIERFELVQMNINPASPLLAGHNVVGGSIVVNHTTNEIVASFYRPMPICPPGHMCPMFMPAPLIIHLPISYVGTGVCGNLVVEAQKVLGLDGGLTKISLIDERTNSCAQDLVGQLTLNVTLTEETALHQHAISTFIGK